MTGVDPAMIDATMAMTDAAGKAAIATDAGIAVDVMEAATTSAGATDVVADVGMAVDVTEAATTRAGMTDANVMVVADAAMRVRVRMDVVLNLKMVLVTSPWMKDLRCEKCGGTAGTQNLYCDHVARGLVVW